MRGRQCGAGEYIPLYPREDGGEEGRGGRAGGNKTTDLEDVSFASKGSVIEVDMYIQGLLGN